MPTEFTVAELSAIIDFTETKPLHEIFTFRGIGKLPGVAGNGHARRLGHKIRLSAEDDNDHRLPIEFKGYDRQGEPEIHRGNKAIEYRKIPACPAKLEA